MRSLSPHLRALLSNLQQLRLASGISERELEEKLILGPGWIRRFENGETVPNIDIIFAILHAINSNIQSLVRDLPPVDDGIVERAIFAKQQENNLDIHFPYGIHNAVYKLNNAKVDDFESVIKVIRNGLALLVNEQKQEDLENDEENNTIVKAIKTDAVANAYLTAVRLFPSANPSDLWYFLIYRAFLDPYNHPAQFARLDYTQSWKRTGGWALEKILVLHYGPFLSQHGIRIFIADGAKKLAIINELPIQERIEADKIDVVLTGEADGRSIFFGVVHVKASFAERRTDDVPLSKALKEAGFTSPLCTMDCKAQPSSTPINRGELGSIEGRRSAKRRDIEEEGYFTGCFSYNLNTYPSKQTLPPEKRIYVCTFQNPDDDFSRFIIEQWHRFRSVQITAR